MPVPGPVPVPEPQPVQVDAALPTISMPLKMVPSFLALKAPWPTPWYKEEQELFMAPVANAVREKIGKPLQVKRCHQFKVKAPALTHLWLTGGGGRRIWVALRRL